MDFGRKIKQLRQENGLTQSDIAKVAGVSDGAVSTWERGTALPRIGTIEILSRYFGITKSELLGETLDAIKKDGKPSRRIPVYGYIPAGIPLEAITAIDDWEDIPGDWEGEYMALRVHGDSMSPRYLDGDVVIIRRQPDCESRQCCAVLIDGEEVTLKQVIKVEGAVVLQPINPAYRAHTYSSADMVTILGVVVELRRSEV